MGKKTNSLKIKAKQNRKNRKQNKQLSLSLYIVQKSVSHFACLLIRPYPSVSVSGLHLHLCTGTLRGGNRKSHQLASR